MNAILIILKALSDKLSWEEARPFNALIGLFEDRLAVWHEDKWGLEEALK